MFNFERIKELSNHWLIGPPIKMNLKNFGAGVIFCAASCALAYLSRMYPEPKVEKKEDKKENFVKKDKSTTICDSALDCIGDTPCVRLNRIPQSEGVECEIVAKCKKKIEPYKILGEFFNAGGSVKDRIGKNMILEAEKSGRIKKGDTLVNRFFLCNI
jgi:hypothetical protein